MKEDGTLKVEEIMRRIDRLQEKIKFKAFGKTKPRTEKSRLGQEQKAASGMEAEEPCKTSEREPSGRLESQGPRIARSRLGQEPKAAPGMEAEELCKTSQGEPSGGLDSQERKACKLLERQSRMLEKEINDIKIMKHGRMTKVFKMREKITGSKKQSQEAHAVLNKEGNLVVSNKDIMKVSLEHCLSTFKNTEPHEDAMMLVKVKEDVHEIRMKADCTDTFEIEKDDFNEVLERFNRKKRKRVMISSH